MMQAPLAEQPRIVLLGVRNAGKSSLMNALFEKQIAIVSASPGTTTDPVTRSFEIPGFGPAAIVDTAGIDDEGDLGEQRIRSSLERYKSADMVLFISSAAIAPSETEKELYQNLFGKNTKKSSRPALLILTHGNSPINADKRVWLEQAKGYLVDNPKRAGIAELITGIAAHRPESEPTPLEGLVEHGDTVILVTPIDSAAPTGRMILPQVETIRDALDKDCAVFVVKENDLNRYYHSLKERPRLVVTDSQAFRQVAEQIPADQPLTSFSILFARKKGDLNQYTAGLKALNTMPTAANVLVLESCSHHRQADDIGTVKIPKLFDKHCSKGASFNHVRQLPSKKELMKYDLVIQCASCMLTRSKVMSRLNTLTESGVPITNYGLFLAWVNGLFPRALEPIPEM
jgi:[FeFe] hydrogenase H-cluster maturation GTPase HydF